MQQQGIFWDFFLSWHCRGYFEKDVDFTNNTPTSRDYILGPGDEIILSLWGETNSRQKFVLSREGLIYYDKVMKYNVTPL